MLYFRRFFMCAFALLFLLVPAGFAFDDWQAIDPADLKMTSEPNAPGADAVILYREEVHSDMRRFESCYVRIKILTEKGKDLWSHVDIPPYKKREWLFDYNHYYGRPSTMNVESIQARTIHSDGTVIPFDGHVVDKIMDKDTESETVARSFVLPQVEVGSIIEYRYTKRWSQAETLSNSFRDIPHAPIWIVQHDLYQRKAIFNYEPFDFGRWNGMSFGGHTIANSHEELLTNVFWVSFLPPEIPQPTKDPHYIKLSVQNLAALPREPFMPPAEQMKYRVRFFFTYGSDNAQQVDDYWEKERKYWKKDIEKFIGSVNHFDALVASIVALGDTQEQRAEKLYNEVQKMENFSYSRAASDSDSETQKKLPKSAEEVLALHGGYSSDLARFYVALLRSAGLEAYLMRVSSRDKWLFEKTILDVAQFDQEIVIVKIDGKEIFLDPGSKFCPFGMLDWRRTGVQGMRETQSGKVDFAQTPQAESKPNKTQRFAKMKLADNGDLSGKITLQFVGQAALSHRQAAITEDEAGRARNLEDELKSWLPQGSMVKLEVAAYWDDVSKPLVARFDVTIPSYAASADKRLTAPVGLFHSDPTQAFSVPTRVQSVYFPYPYYETDDVTVQLPDDLQVEDLPKLTKEPRDFGAYLIKADADKQTLKLHRELLMEGFVFPAKYYPDVRSFFDKVKAGDDQQVVLHSAAVQSAK